MAGIIETRSNSTVQLGSDRSFGIVFSAVFAVFALWPVLNGASVRLPVLVAGLAFLLVALVAPRILHFPNKLWFRFGLLLGAITAPIAMAIVYFVVVVPMGLGLRAFGKDLLRARAIPDADTYWLERKQKPQSMVRQF